MESMEMESRRAALLPEEAALKNALPRRSAAGSAALREMLREMDRMNDALLAGEVSAAAGETASGTGGALPRSRAALHHILRW